MNWRDISLRDLVSLCIKSGREEAWEEVIERVQPAFASIAWHIAQERGSTQASDVDDLLQEVFMKLAARGNDLLSRLPQDSDEAAQAYLKVFAANVIRDSLRTKHAGKRGQERTANLNIEVLERLAVAAPVMDADTEVLLSQIDCALDVDAAERTIFWLYYRTGLTAKEIAGLPTVVLGAKGVESLIRRLIDKVRGAFESGKPEMS